MELFLLVLMGLGVLIVASMLSRRTGIATPLLLLVLGLAFSYVPQTPEVHLQPEWILAGVLPPLLYSSSRRLPMVDLSRNFKLVTWLSVVLVIASAVAVGALVHLIIPEIPLALAIALGAVVSPTDAVAATAIGSRLGLPNRLMTVLEGESLLNDATALVLLRTAIAAVAGSFSIWSAAGSFLWAVGAAVVIGWLIGGIVVWLYANLGDPVLTTSVSFAVPFMAFFPAEELHASGVIAVVMTGLTVGTLSPRFVGASDRTMINTTWASVNFILEHAVFLVMGLQLPQLLADAADQSSTQRFALTAAAVLALLVVVRCAGVALALAATGRRAGRHETSAERLELRAQHLAEIREQDGIDDEHARQLALQLERGRADLRFKADQAITARGGAVIVWAGMRGVVTLAAAQTLPLTVNGAATPYRATLILLAFAVAVVSLTIFGGTLPWLIRRLDFEQRSDHDQRAELHSLMRQLTDRVVAELGSLKDQEIDGQKVPAWMAERVTQRLAPMLLARDNTDPGQQTGMLEFSLALQRRYLNAYREALNEARFVGAFSTQTLQRAQRMLDREEQRLDGS